MLNKKTLIDLAIALLLILLIKGVSSFFSSQKTIITDGEVLTLYDINFVQETRSKSLPSSELKIFKSTDHTQFTSFKLSDHKGKIIILHFWGIDCPPCRHELPSYNTFVKSHPEIVHIPLTILPNDPQALKQTQEALIQFRAPDLPLILDEKSNIARFFNISGLPSTVFINKKGNIVGQIIGTVDWQTPEVVSLILKTIETSEEPNA